MKRLIKKYKNRRLYDTDKSEYITVEDLQQYVIEGVLFEVQDSQSGKDITASTLLQIFVEMESRDNPFLSEDMLRQIIIASHHPMHHSFKNMLEQMLSSMKQALQLNPVLKDYKKAAEAWQEGAGLMMKQWQDIFKK